MWGSSRRSREVVYGAMNILQAVAWGGMRGSEGTWVKCGGGTVRRAGELSVGHERRKEPRRTPGSSA